MKSIPPGQRHSPVPKLAISAEPLEAYLSAAGETQSGLLEERPSPLKFLFSIERHFRDELFAPGLRLDPTAGLLAQQSYSCLLASTRIAMSGHGTVVFPVLRVMLEAACYCYLLAKQHDLVAIWLNRSNDEKSFKSFRGKFTSAVKDTAKLLAPLNSPLADRLLPLYDSSIAMGAHPCPQAIFEHLRLNVGDSTPASAMHELGVMYGQNAIETMETLLSCSEYGIASMAVIALAAKDHPLARTGDTTIATLWDDLATEAAKLETSSWLSHAMMDPEE